MILRCYKGKRTDALCSQLPSRLQTRFGSFIVAQRVRSAVVRHEDGVKTSELKNLSNPSHSRSPEGRGNAHRNRSSEKASLSPGIGLL